MEQPKIKHEGRDYFEVACRKCGKGGYWKVYSDGSEIIAKCKCGHSIVIGENILKNEPDADSLPFHQII